MASFFVTGTDTGVGKTFFTCWLVRAWRLAGHNGAALKPLSSGPRQDALDIREAMGLSLTLDEINPVHFQESAAPLFAARSENRSIDFPALNQDIRALSVRFSHLAVEGIGGWRVPLAIDYEVCDWARDLGFPVVVIARAGLGTLNHTLLTVDSIRASGLVCTGLIVNSGPPDISSPLGTSPDFDLTGRRNIDLLRDLLGLPLFEFNGRAQTAGHVPVWLGGEKI